MILDDLNLNRFTLQIQYPPRYLVWDRAGEAAHRLIKIWGELELEKSDPNEQILKNQEVSIHNGLKTCHLTLLRPRTIDASVLELLQQTFHVWREVFAVTTMTRVSARIKYVRDFPTHLAANEKLFSLGLHKRPSVKVFDLPVNAAKNTAEIVLKFEDDNSFAAVYVKTEALKIEIDGIPDFDLPSVEKSKNRLILEFDRGSLGNIDSDGFRCDEWTKGFIHLLRRDIEKALGL